MATTVIQPTQQTENTTRRRFTLEQSVLLLEEVKNQNPFASNDSEEAWDRVVTVLNQAKVRLQFFREI